MTQRAREARVDAHRQRIEDEQRHRSEYQSHVSKLEACHQAMLEAHVRLAEAVRDKLPQATIMERASVLAECVASWRYLNRGEGDAAPTVTGGTS